ncbi:MAG: hypothetical protein ACP5Q1_07010 [Anaerolineae bacterium]
MGIPEFLLRKLYVRDSYVEYPDGFSFALLNSFVLAHLTELKLEGDGQSIPSVSILIQSPGQNERSADSITPATPYVLPVGTQVTVRVCGVPLHPRKLTIRAKTREAGLISFTLVLGRDHPSRAEEVGPASSPQEIAHPLALHFSERDWERVQHDWKAWWAGELARPLVVAMGGTAADFSEILQNYPLEVPANQVLESHRTALEAARYYGDAYPKWWPNFGPGVLAAFLGAEVRWEPETAWFEPLAFTSLADLHPMYNPDNIWWRRVQEFVRGAVAAWGNQVAVGHTDLGGLLDVLASLRGTSQLLLDLYDAPQEVERLEAELTTLWLRYYDELCALIEPAGHGTTCWGPCWFPGRGYMLQSDFSYMISPQMFERFVLPNLAICCEAMDYAFYHLDGPGQIKHLDMLLSIPRLRGIQWVPGESNPPPERWLPLLKRIRDGGKLCYVDVTCAGALQIVRALGGRGFLFRITEYLDPQEAADFLSALIPQNS